MAEPSKELIVRGSDVTTLLTAGFQAGGHIQKTDWEKYSIYIQLSQEGGNVVKLQFYKKGNEPKIEEEPEPIVKEGNVLYFPTVSK